MQSITLRVLQGADRGRVFSNLQTPVTIGREEGNGVQLNDERISRYHVKIQEDEGRLVVTDLDSTNGTRINGHPCNLKILRNGDTISVGRTVLLVGNRDLVMAEDPPVIDGNSDQAGDDGYDTSTRIQASQNGLSSRDEAVLPRGLTPGQSAELRELLDHIHRGVRIVIENATVNEREENVTIPSLSWKNLLVMQSDISVMIRNIEDPTSGPAQSNDTGAD